MDKEAWKVKQLPITKELYVACGTELIAGGLTETNAHLIASAPDLYEACNIAHKDGTTSKATRIAVGQALSKVKEGRG